MPASERLKRLGRESLTRNRLLVVTVSHVTCHESNLRKPNARAGCHGVTAPDPGAAALVRAVARRPSFLGGENTASSPRPSPPGEEREKTQAYSLASCGVIRRSDSPLPE